MEASGKFNDWAFADEIQVHQAREGIESSTIAYMLYQALILCFITGALHVGAGDCRRWIAAGLSLSLSVLHFSYLVEAFPALLRAQRDADQARMELGRAHACLEANRMIRARFFLGGPATEEEVRCRAVKRQVVSGAVGVLLVVFAAVMLVACTRL